MTSSTTLVWFQQDLRITDQPALAHAAASGGDVVAFFVLDDQAAGPWAMGGASRWWLHQSLRSLSKQLAALGIPLVLRRGRTRDVVRKVAAETKAGAVVASRRYEPWASRLEQQVHDDLEADGIAFSRYRGTLLFDPDQVRTKSGEPYKVYTPFWNAVSATSLRTPTPKPAAQRQRVAKLPKSDELDDWRLLPTKPDWAGGLCAEWTPGELGAKARLDRFLDQALRSYGADRNRPDRIGTSRLSPHLHFGEISPAVCWHRAVARAAGDPGSDDGLAVFLKELTWREFSYHLLWNWPDLPEAPFRPEFARFPWRTNAQHLRAWQQGMTGYPIVDAGMRELWATGWMHNRVRMIVGSFLVKDLLIPWQQGEAWFWDCLVDADLAANAASWQWIAGCGADAAPYFRVFNPQLQGEKFDPEGGYVRRWVPELAKLPGKWLHAPASAPSEVLAQAGVVLGKTYPAPIVEHGKARAAALAAFAQVKA